MSLYSLLAIIYCFTPVYIVLIFVIIKFNKYEKKLIKLINSSNDKNIIEHVIKQLHLFNLSDERTNKTIKDVLNSIEPYTSRVSDYIKGDFLR
jgi:hypothetical protein